MAAYGTGTYGVGTYGVGEAQATTWADEALARGAAVVLSLDETTGNFDNAASTTDAAVTVGTPTRGEPSLAWDGGKSLKLTNISQTIDTFLTSTNLVDCSVEFMIKTTAASGLLVYSRGTGPGIRLGLGAAPVGGGNNGGVYFGVNGDSIWWGVSTDVLINDGQPHHIACVWNGTSGVAVGAGQFTIYVDGAPVATQDRTYTSTTPPLTAMGSWRIGVNEAPVDTWLDNLSIYPNVVLTQADVTALRDKQLTPTVAPTEAPVVTAQGLNASAQISWTAAAYAQTYEYRINGGAPVSTGATRSATVTGLTNGTAYTVEARALNSVGPGPWSAPVSVTPSTIIYFDDFNRANSTNVPGAPATGGPYTVRTGTWGINSNALYTSASTSEAHMTFPAVVDLEATIKLATPGSNGGVLFRWVDANNTWLFQWTASGYYFHRRTGGTWQQQGTGWAKVPVAGDVLRLIAVGRTILAYRNGTLIMSAEDHYVNVATGTMGYRFSSETNTRLDEVAVQPGALPTNPPGDLVIPDYFLTDGMHDNGFLYKGRDTKLADQGAVA